jgi:hypothetical protein
MDIYCINVLFIQTNCKLNGGIKMDNSEYKTPSGKKDKLKMIFTIILIIVIGFGAVSDARLTGSGRFINLKRSSGDVVVEYIDRVPSVSVQKSRVMDSEEDIFKYSTSIFKGKILGIQNIKIIFCKLGSEYYQAIVKVKIDEVYHGHEKAGDTVEMRIESPVGITVDQWIEDREDYYAMRLGAEGVFMATEYKENDYWEEVDSRLYVKEISDYCLRGERCAIIQNENGYFFRGNSPILYYDSFNDVKKYVLEMIKLVK